MVIEYEVNANPFMMPDDCRMCDFDDNYVSGGRVSFVTLVPWLLSHLFHDHCHTCSKVLERL